MKKELVRFPTIMKIHCPKCKKQEYATYHTQDNRFYSYYDCNTCHTTGKVKGQLTVKETKLLKWHRQRRMEDVEKQVREGDKGYYGAGYKDEYNDPLKQPKKNDKDREMDKLYKEMMQRSADRKNGFVTLKIKGKYKKVYLK